VTSESLANYNTIKESNNRKLKKNAIS